MYEHPTPAAGSSQPLLRSFRYASRCLIVLCSLLLCTLFAQERFTALNGSVRDASGAVIPNVQVTLRNLETQRVTTATTNETGAFIVRNLEPGRYELSAEAGGFQKFVAADLTLQLGKELTIPVVLQVSQAQTSVQVTDSAPLIDTTGVTVTNNISSAEFDRLPKARSFQSLVLTSPSVNTGQIEGGFQINGASGAENQFFIDGISTNSLVDGRSRQNAAYEFLQEVQVKTGGIEAEYGGALGGVVSAITKSGGNQFHGEAHFYWGGNGISAGPVKRLFLKDPYSNLGTNPLYVQDHKFDNNQYEPGGSVGGYLLKNKIWFFTSYSPQFLRRSNNYLFNKGTEPDTISSKTTNQQLFNKLSWDPHPRIRTNFSWLWTPTRNEGILPAYDWYGNSVATDRNSVQTLKNQGWSQPQSNYSGQVDWTTSSTSVLSVRGGRFWDNFRTFGIPQFSSVTNKTASTGIPGAPDYAANSYNTPRTQATNFDITTRSYYQVDFSKFVASAWGSHDLKIGGGTQKTVNKVDVGYPGGGYVFVYWNGALQRNDGTTDRGQYGYYEVDNIGTRGTTGGTMNNLYIQDKWKIHPRVTLNLGLRTENEHVPSFNRSIRDDAFSFPFTSKMSPRLGVSYDVFGNGKLKTYFSYGRYYDWVKYETARGTFGGDFWQVYYRSLDTTNVYSLSGTNMPGRNIWNEGPYVDNRVPSFDAVAKDLKPMSTDLINAGAEYQLSQTLVLRVNYTRNNLVRTIEDMGAIVNGNETYLFANPGEGQAAKFATSTATPVFDTPKPHRTYDAVEITLNRRFANRFFASASYVYSRLYGNYAGLGNSDEISTPTTGVSSATTQQSGGSIARPGSTGSRAWDIDQILFDSHGKFVEGLLATDRPHVVKLYGSYTTRWNQEIGGFFYGGSGTPMSTVVNQVQRIPLFVEGRGDMGRTPFLTQTDLVLAQEVKMGERKRLRFEFNAQNVFNQKTARHIFNQLNRGAGTGLRAAALNLGSVNLFNGYDYKTMLNTIQTNTGLSVYDPRYGMNDLWNPGFTGRVLVKFVF